MKNHSSAVVIERLANLFEISGVLLVLMAAFVLQFVFNELPCPLCLLQRFGFMVIAFGFVLNFRFGFRPSHYSIILLGGLFTAFVALRQIALHVIPGTGAYGSAIFGLHLYTWSFVIAMLIVVSTSLLLGVDRQYLQNARKNKYWEYIVHVLFAALLFLSVSNIISAVFECGFKQCPDNPMHYELLR